MKILLVQPPLPKNASRMLLMPPLGLSYLASAVAKRGHDPGIMDCAALHLAPDDLSGSIRPGEWDAIGLTGTTAQSREIAETARVLKPKTNYLIAGGPYATSAPREFFEAVPEADLLVRGEAEEALPNLLDSLESGKDPTHVQGVCIRGGNLSRTARPVRDLNALPRPARRLLPRKLYRHPLAKAGPVTSMMTSRGCNHACTFCDKSVTRGKWRARAPGDVVEEMLELAAAGYGEITIYDDDFLHDVSRAMDICDKLCMAGSPIAFSCEARPEGRDRAVYSALKQAGCRRISFGIDAGTQAGLEELNKGFSMMEAEEQVFEAKNAGLEILVYYIIGLRSEPPDRLDCLNSALRLEPDFVQFSVLEPYPGSRLAKMQDKSMDLAAESSVLGPADLGPGRKNPYYSTKILLYALKRSYLGFYGRPVYAAKRLLHVESCLQLKWLAFGALGLFSWIAKRWTA